MMTTTSAVGSSNVQRGRAERRGHTSILSSITFPVLIVGDEDAFTPVESAEYMHTHIVTSRLVIIKQSGHVSNMEQATQFNFALREFLNTVA